MEKNQIIDTLKSLMQLDVDASHAYDQAIKRVDESDADIKSQLEVYQGDHDRHVERLADLIRQQGEEPPKVSPDLSGFLIEGFTALRSMMGTDGALKAMEGNEKLTNKKYSNAHGLDLPQEIKTVIDENYDDEKRHLQYIQEKLSVYAR
ncbi:MAG: DUF2383 domain-containing protein [Chitinivibrionales bacterium]|nr:DUF2383 domain-containing protein [Chitinivibrionales bacterium]